MGNGPNAGKAIEGVGLALACGRIASGIEGTLVDRGVGLCRVE